MNSDKANRDTSVQFPFCSQHLFFSWAELHGPQLRISPSFIKPFFALLLNLETSWNITERRKKVGWGLSLIHI